METAVVMPAQAETIAGPERFVVRLEGLAVQQVVEVHLVEIVARQWVIEVAAQRCTLRKSLPMEWLVILQ